MRLCHCQWHCGTEYAVALGDPAGGGGLEAHWQAGCHYSHYYQ
jgi:hypothetical protein